MLKQQPKALVERCLNGEIQADLEAAEGEGNAQEKGHRRNGYSQKPITGEFGRTEMAVPRDRLSEFTPQILPKGQTRVSGFDPQLLSLDARGMSTRDIPAQLVDL